MRELTRPLAALLTGVVLLAGCGGSAEPKPLPKSKASTSPSASASPPAMPEAARSKTKAGANAAVRFFLTSMEHAGDTGQTAAFESSYTKECTRCTAITKGIRNTYSSGGSIEGGAWRPTRLKAYGIENDIAYVDAVVDYEPQVWTRGRGKSPVKAEAQRGVLKAFHLTWTANHWRVAALDPEL